MFCGTARNPEREVLIQLALVEAVLRLCGRISLFNQARPDQFTSERIQSINLYLSASGTAQGKRIALDVDLPERIIAVITDLQPDTRLTNNQGRLTFAPQKRWY
jgi:hypothetical protein